MNKNYSIEFATKKDAGGIAELYRGWQEFLGVLPKELCEIETTSNITKYFMKNTTRKFIVAKKPDKTVIGVCYLDISWQGLKNIRLGDMFIHKNYRNIGIGSALIDKVIDYARKNKIKKIWLWTQKELKPAIKLYEKKGFIYEGTQKAQFCGKDALLYGVIL